MTEPFLILGHRGSPKQFPENTIPSFDEALRARADGFETDLRRLADGTAVLFHDDELVEDEIESLTLAQCTERGLALPRVGDLGRYAGRAKMMLEVKRAGWEEAILEIVSAWPDIMVASFDHSVVVSMRKLGAAMPLGIILSGSIVGIAEYAQNLGAAWVFPDFHYVDAEMVASLHARGIKVMPWSPNRRREWDRLRAAGCDGIITDVPDKAIAWRDG